MAGCSMSSEVASSSSDNAIGGEEDISSQHMCLMDVTEVSDEVNNILHFTVLNPLNEISVDIMMDVFRPYEQLISIVIFKDIFTHGVLEFDCDETAKRALESLNRHDIYAGCCTLELEYSALHDLSPYKNDVNSWWSWNNDEGSSQSLEPPTPSLLDSGVGEHVMNNIEEFQSTETSLSLNTGESMAHEMKRGHSTRNRRRRNRQPFAMYRSAHRARVHRESRRFRSHILDGDLNDSSTVVLVRDFCAKRANPDALFNLFCLYGNVVQIKFLRLTPGSALVEMSDNVSAKKCISMYDKKYVLGSRLNISLSNLVSVTDDTAPFRLADSSISSMNYLTGPNNRFMNEDQFSKDVMQRPNKILHFFNTPPNVCKHDIEAVFSRRTANQPKIINIFPRKDDESYTTGLLEFHDILDAINAVALCNHADISVDRRSQYIMKLCFSSSRTIDVSSSGRAPNTDDTN